VTVVHAPWSPGLRSSEDTGPEKPLLRVDEVR
jgi:hypothetical protein